MIKLDEINEICIPQFNNGKGNTLSKMFMNDEVKIIKTTLEKGSSIGLHIHDKSSEVVYVLSGCAKCTLNGEEEIVNSGEVHYCQIGSNHSIANNCNDPLIFLDIVY